MGFLTMYGAEGFRNSERFPDHVGLGRIREFRIC